MSSSTLATIQTQLNLYGYSIFMILGNIGNIFVVILFSRQRQNACSIYLLSSAIVNILYLTINGFIQLFPYNPGEGTMRVVIFCKIFAYIPNTLGQIAKTMLVLACIDRFLITDGRATFRAYSTPKRAKYLIFFSIIFWLVISIHVPIMSTIVNRKCTRVGIYLTIFTVYIILFVGLIPSLTMSVFGYLTYRNMRQLRNRIQPMRQDLNEASISIRRRDRDLLILVISEVLVYIITTSLFPIVLLEMMISQYVMPNKSLQYIQTEVFIYNIGAVLLYINSAVPFYTYLISSKSFRRDFKQFCINNYRKLRHPPVQTVPGKDHILTYRDTRM